MFKICKIIILLIFVSFPLSVNAHVQHYEDLSRIEFDIYRNNKHIGTHIFSFKKSEGQLAVESEINFEIKKLGIVFYSYHVKGTEIYKAGRLIKFNSKTNLPSLMPYFVGNLDTKIELPYVFTETGGLQGPFPSPIEPNVFCIKNSRYKLIFFKTSKEWKMFDLIKDPREEENIFGKQIKEEKVLQDKLTKWINR